MLDVDHLPRGCLYGLLRCDFEPGGNRMLLPYLTTNDLLRLSECSQTLMPCRKYLSTIKLSKCCDLRKGLYRLLEDQQGQVRHVHLGSRSLVPVLEDIVCSGYLPGLQVLDLSEVELWDEDAPLLERLLLVGQALRGMEALDIRGRLLSFTAAGLGRVMGALSQGSCPRLRRLGLAGSRGPNGCGQAIAAALGGSDGHFRCLMELSLACLTLGPGGVEVFQALGLGACPDLRLLNITDCMLSTGDGLALAATIRRGALSKLEVLQLSRNPSLGDEGLVPILGALEGGVCPTLQRLDLAQANLTETGGTALAYTLVSPCCGDLRWLDASTVCGNKGGTHRICEAVRQGGCPQLRHLDLSWSQLDHHHSLVLGAAMASGCCPHLEELLLSGNMSLGDDGVAHLAKALAEPGGCQRLRHVALNTVGLGPQGPIAIANALNKSGCLKSLRKIELDANEAIGDASMAHLIGALASSCPDLVLLSVGWTSMGQEAGDALLRALRENTWPRLQTLQVVNESLSSSWVADLALAFEVGKGLVASTLRSLALYCSTADGFRRLNHAFGEGACPLLTSLFVTAVLPEHDDGSSVRDLTAQMESRSRSRCKVQVEYPAL